MSLLAREKEEREECNIFSMDWGGNGWKERERGCSSIPLFFHLSENTVDEFFCKDMCRYVHCT